MRYLLDAGTIAELLRGSPLAALRLSLCSPTDVAIPAPALGELHAAIHRLPRAGRRRSITHDLDDFVSFVGVVPLSAAAAVAAVRLAWRSRRGLATLSPADLQNMAIAQVEGRVLVTTRARAIGRVPGLAVENWAEQGMELPMAGRPPDPAP